MIREIYEDEEGNQHAIESQNNKDRSKYYSYVKICKTYNEQNKLIEEAYFENLQRTEQADRGGIF